MPTSKVFILFFLLFYYCSVHQIILTLAKLAISLCHPICGHWIIVRTPSGVDKIIDEVGHFYRRLI